MNVNFEIGPPERSLNPGFDQLIQHNLTENQLFEAEPIWGNIFTLGLKGAHKWSNPPKG